VPGRFLLERIPGMGGPDIGKFHPISSGEGAVKKYVFDLRPGQIAETGPESPAREARPKGLAEVLLSRFAPPGAVRLTFPSLP
jgi:hypothetical protein